MAKTPTSTSDTPEVEQPVKTGEVFFRDESDILWLAESWQYANGDVKTTTTVVDE